MSVLKCKTRGNTSPQGKPRVYFCCHPRDFAACFESVSNDLLKHQNCAVYYADEATPRDEDFFQSLKQMQLFVMPVTTDLLCTKNPTRDTEYRFALDNHIPVLPLMQESGLEELFNKKCGALQFLDPYSADLTAISYDEKLKTYLQSVLIGDELAEKIRAAFDAYVFLSYRKKDRKYARELMHLIHKHDFCRDLAIWYDEFLTPGESFNDSIKDALLKSSLFVMAVTPNLVSEPNYIMSTEYPMAQQEGKPILPAELLPTDYNLLREKYGNIPVPTNPYNEAELSQALLDALKKMAIKENDASPEHNFFIGLAYLGGIDVEVDQKKAKQLIASAAETGLPAAMKKLVEMYREGICVEKDFPAAIHWQTTLIETMQAQYRTSPDKKNALEVLDCQYTLGDMWESHSNYPEAVNGYAQCLIFCEELLRQQPEDVHFLRQQVYIYRSLGYVKKLLGNHDEAFREYRKAYDLAVDLSNKTEKAGDFLLLSGILLRMGEFIEEQFNYANARQAYEDARKIMEQTADLDSFAGRRRTADVYLRLGTVCKKQKKHTEALEYYRIALDAYEKLAAEYATVTNRLNISLTHNLIGNVYLAADDDCSATDEYLIAYEQVFELYKESQSLDVQRQIMICCGHLADISKMREQYDRAEELYLDALDFAKTIADTTDTVAAHRDLRVSCGNLADLYKLTGDRKKEFQLRFFALDEAKKVAETNACQDMLDLTYTYHALAEFLQRLGQSENALSQHENAYRIRKMLAGQLENTTMLEALHFSCITVADLHKELGDISNARTYYREAVCVCEKLVAMDATTENLDALGTSCMSQASVETGEAQLELLRKACGVYEKLCSRHPKHQRFLLNLDAIRGYIAELEKKARGGFLKRLFGK